MRVLIVHAVYQSRGGEDQAVENDVALLRDRGHEVVVFSRPNSDLAEENFAVQALSTVWNTKAQADLRGLLRRTNPDIVHFHNTFPGLSPAVLRTAAHEGYPVVLSVHNYRISCAAGTFFRSGSICEDCIGKTLPWPAVLHRCYRSSAAASGAVALMQATHNLIGTYDRSIDRFLALTAFSKDMLEKVGVPGDRIGIRPNFLSSVPLPKPDLPSDTALNDYALFVGRLSPEKGLNTLLEAWRYLDSPMKLIIAGEGPLHSVVSQFAAKDPRIVMLGAVPHDEVHELMSSAKFLIFPSVCYEGLPMTIIESFAAGTPVIASNLGSMAELIVDGQTGKLFRPGSATNLAAVISNLQANEPGLLSMRANCRLEYALNYAVENAYTRLMEQYQFAIESHSRKRIHGDSRC